MSVPEIREMRSSDASAVLKIYADGIATGHATFEEAPPSWEDWDASHLSAGRLVAVDNGKIVGWAALTGVSSRCIYAGVAEVSVYVATAARRRGIGGLLMERLIAASEEAGIWTLQAGIFPENGGSIDLHRRAGFRVVGTRKRVGRMSYGPCDGTWRDVIMLERRSARVGTD
jgi:phosphinothricin acetyltransferase